jgi:CRISPR/Cas system Type II protein with McrA/HNH and RuvC-like nuclease domain
MQTETKEQLRARRSALNGILKILHNHGVTDKAKQNELIELFCSQQGIDLPLNKTITTACVEIQKRFKDFIKWLPTVTIR